jgi:hypothetical protein
MVASTATFPAVVAAYHQQPLLGWLHNRNHMDFPLASPYQNCELETSPEEAACLQAVAEASLIVAALFQISAVAAAWELVGVAVSIFVAALTALVFAAAWYSVAASLIEVEEDHLATAGCRCSETVVQIQHGKQENFRYLADNALRVHCGTILRKKGPYQRYWDPC